MSTAIILHGDDHGIKKIRDNYYEITLRPDRRRPYYLGAPTLRPEVFALPDERWWPNGKQFSRDSQRQKCYDAEQSIRCLIQQKTFSGAREVATYFRNVMESDWFQRRFPHFKRLCIVRKRLQAAHARVGYVAFGSWALGLRGRGGGEMIMLHELAHAVLPVGTGHHRRWARTFLEFVTHYMGDVAGEKLRQAFISHRVKFKPIRQVSDEQRARMSLLGQQRQALRLSGGLPLPITLHSAR